ncbi:MAG: hypothetical protein IBX39_09205 [Candidatus Methanoperedenaceae archaeon]|nr:hypothetical protein [Candidatus Methanoperedenaceae archaeon]
MVTLDPCKRLETIQNQLIPAILKSAAENTSSDIKMAIEHNLPDLEEDCKQLMERCQQQFPECGKEIELCNKARIIELFTETREKLDKIFEERAKREKNGDLQATGSGV